MKKIFISTIIIFSFFSTKESALAKYTLLDNINSIDKQYEIPFIKISNYTAKETYKNIFEKSEYLDSHYLLVFDSSLIKEDLEAEEKVNNKKKSLGLAIILGAIPINGLGHFYAEKYITGSILLGIETITICDIIYVYSNPERFSDREGLDALADSLGRVVFWLILLSGTYLYDVIGAPISVYIQNEKINNKQSYKIVPYNYISESENIYFGFSIKY